MQPMNSRILFQIALALSAAGVLTPTVLPAPGDGLASDDIKVQAGGPATVVPQSIEHLKVRLSWGNGQRPRGLSASRGIRKLERFRFHAASR
jgi:hypothetical protein